MSSLEDTNAAHWLPPGSIFGANTASCEAQEALAFGRIKLDAADVRSWPKADPPCDQHQQRGQRPPELAVSPDGIRTAYI